MVARALLMKVFVFSVLATSWLNIVEVGGSLNDQPPTERNTFNAEFLCLRAVVRIQRRSSPGAISMSSYKVEISANA